LNEFFIYKHLEHGEMQKVAKCCQ